MHILIELLLDSYSVAAQLQRGMPAMKHRGYIRAWLLIILSTKAVVSSSQSINLTSSYRAALFYCLGFRNGGIFDHVPAGIYVV